MNISNGWDLSSWESNPAKAADEGFQESRMREICMSGSTRGEWAALARCRPLSYSTG
jgi:hypothetical protein